MSQDRKRISRYAADRDDRHVYALESQPWWSEDSVRQVVASFFDRVALCRYTPALGCVSLVVFGGFGDVGTLDESLSREYAVPYRL